MLRKFKGWLGDRKDQSDLNTDWQRQIQLSSTYYQGSTGDFYSFAWAGTGDIPDLLMIQAQAYGDIPWPRESLRHDLERNPQSSYIIVRDARGSACAFVSFWWSRRESHVSNLCVVPQHQGSGLGTALMGLVQKATSLMDLPQISLEVRVSNRPAIQMYKKIGFRPLSIKKAYYHSNGEDALNMVYYLPDQA